MNAVSKAEFAAMQGWSRAYVTQLSKAGRLVLTDDGKVNVEASLRKLAATTDPSKDGVKRRWKDERRERDVGQHVRYDAPDPGDDEPASLYDYQEARAKRETHLANIAEMEEAVKAGALLERQAVEKALVDLTARVPARLEQLLERVCAQLPSEQLREQLYHLLANEHAELCADLAAGMTELLPDLSGGTHES